jgi:hypothetical protein
MTTFLKSVKILVPQKGVAVVGSPFGLTPEYNILAGYTAFEAFTPLALGNALQSFMHIIRPQLQFTSGNRYQQSVKSLESDFLIAQTASLRPREAYTNPELGGAPGFFDTPEFAWCEYLPADRKETPAPVPTRQQRWSVKLRFDASVISSIPPDLEHLVRVWSYNNGKEHVDGELYFWPGWTSEAAARAVVRWAVANGVFEAIYLADDLSVDEMQYA